MGLATGVGTTVAISVVGAGGIVAVGITTAATLAAVGDDGADMRPARKPAAPIPRPNRMAKTASTIPDVPHPLDFGDGT